MRQKCVVNAQYKIFNFGQGRLSSFLQYSAKGLLLFVYVHNFEPNSWQSLSKDLLPSLQMRIQDTAGDCVSPVSRLLAGSTTSRFYVVAPQRVKDTRRHFFNATMCTIENPQLSRLAPKQCSGYTSSLRMLSLTDETSVVRKKSFWKFCNQISSTVELLQQHLLWVIFHVDGE